MIKRALNIEDLEENRRLLHEVFDGLLNRLVHFTYEGLHSQICGIVKSGRIVGFGDPPIIRVHESPSADGTSDYLVVDTEGYDVAFNEYKGKVIRLGLIDPKTAKENVINGVGISGRGRILRYSVTRPT